MRTRRGAREILPGRGLSLAALLLALAAGCTRLVSVEVDEGPKRLVVEGRIELGVPFQRIVLSTTDVFSSPSAPPPATGAVVFVTDDRGHRCDYLEAASPSGIYFCDFVPEAGATYTLTIDYEGERYQASAALQSGPPIDSLYFKYEEKGIGRGDAGFRAVLDYTDPAGTPNYYLWEMYIDGIQWISVDPGNQFRIISEDRFYDGGRVTGFEPFDEKVLDPGQTIRMRQIALSQDEFRYYTALFEQTAGGGGPFSTPPSSLRGNVANLTAPEHRALGYFSAGRVAERIATVPERQ